MSGCFGKHAAAARLVATGAARAGRRLK